RGEGPRRCASPVEFPRRITPADLRVDGSTVPAGTFMLTCLGSANHDEARWGPTADELDITRPDAGQHMLFGDGIPPCLGSSLARTEAQVAIGTFVRRFPDLELAGEPERNGRVVLRGLERLPGSVGPCPDVPPRTCRCSSRTRSVRTRMFDGSSWSAPAPEAKRPRCRTGTSTSTRATGRGS